MSMRIRLDVSKAVQALDAMASRSDEIGRKILIDVMSELEANAVRLCPVDKGTLRSRIKTRFINDREAVLEDNTNYGAYVEFGTEPHEITPFVKKALHWQQGGRSFFAKRVFHPGTRPQPFFRPARQITIEKIPQIIERRITE